MNDKEIKEQYLKLKQAAKYVGMCHKTFKKHVMPYIPHKKIGGCYYFSLRELEKFMNSADSENKRLDKQAEQILKKILT